VVARRTDSDFFNRLKHSRKFATCKQRPRNRKNTPFGGCAMLLPIGKLHWAGEEPRRVGVPSGMTPPHIRILPGGDESAMNLGRFYSANCLEEEFSEVRYPPAPRMGHGDASSFSGWHHALR
jgi:hypothetical protein